ncbi:hypothetical protein [Rhizomonospora bruguierae]|uniref:hypothetical protein n=1 Tax=Rhizomonospora bruguierae TaxID=1581705 RepID=UPI001BCC69E8|nr:hypothetical protein [Micromonospora sp. NBRC 107566]
MRRTATTVATALLCLAAGACTGDAAENRAPDPTASTATAPAGGPESGGPAPKAFAAPLPDCETMVKHYPQGIYRSVGPYPGETGAPPSDDLEYRYCNTAGYAAADGEVVLTTVITIYRPKTEPYRGIPVAAWQPKQTDALIAEGCPGAAAAAWAGGDGGKRCATDLGAVVVGAGGGAVLRAQVSGKLPRARLESAADRIGRAVLSELS